MFKSKKITFLITLIMLSSCASETFLPAEKISFVDERLLISQNYKPIREKIWINPEQRLTITPVFADGYNDTFRNLVNLASFENYNYEKSSIESEKVIKPAASPTNLTSDSLNLEGFKIPLRHLKHFLERNIISENEFNIFSAEANRQSSNKIKGTQTTRVENENFYNSEYNPFIYNNRFLGLFKVEFDNMGETTMVVSCRAQLTKGIELLDLMTLEDYLSFRNKTIPLNVYQQEVVHRIVCKETESIPPKTKIIKFMPALPLSNEDDNIMIYWSLLKEPFLWVYSDSITQTYNKDTYYKIPLIFKYNGSIIVPESVLIGKNDARKHFYDNSSIFVSEENISKIDDATIIAKYLGSFFIFRGKINYSLQIDPKLEKVKPILVNLNIIL